MRTKDFLMGFFMAAVFCGLSSVNAQQADTLWFKKIDLTRFTQDWNLTPKASLSLEKNPLKIAGEKFRNGLASRTESAIRFKLDGRAQKFYTLFGLDDASNKNT